MSDLKEQFIPYEQAVELQNLGFDERCFGYYSINAVLYYELFTPSWENKIAAPLWQQAFDWFIFKYGLFYTIEVFKDSTKNLVVYYLIFLEETQDEIEGEIKIKSSITETMYDAKLACLNKLIEIVKEKK